MAQVDMEVSIILLLFPITTHADVILPGAAVVMGLAYLCSSVGF